MSQNTIKNRFKLQEKLESCYCSQVSLVCSEDSNPPPVMSLSNTSEGGSSSKHHSLAFWVSQPDAAPPATSLLHLFYTFVLSVLNSGTVSGYIKCGPASLCLFTGSPPCAVLLICFSMSSHLILTLPDHAEVSFRVRRCLFWSLWAEVSNYSHIPMFIECLLCAGRWR